MTTTPLISTSTSNTYTKLLPPANTVRHALRPERPGSETKSAMQGFLRQIKLQHSEHHGSTPSDRNECNESKSIGSTSSASTINLELVARFNTWSRAARRRLAKSTGPSTTTEPTSTPTPTPILLKALIRIMDDSVEMEWTYGRDRADFDSLWKSILANSGLVSRQKAQMGDGSTTAPSLDPSNNRSGVGSPGGTEGEDGIRGWKRQRADQDEADDSAAGLDGKQPKTGS